jgi:hypothetical protein
MFVRACVPACTGSTRITTRKVRVPLCSLLDKVQVRYNGRISIWGSGTFWGGVSRDWQGCGGGRSSTSTWEDLFALQRVHGGREVRGVLRPPVPLACPAYPSHPALYCTIKVRGWSSWGLCAPLPLTATPTAPTRIIVYALLLKRSWPSSAHAFKDGCHQLWQCTIYGWTPLLTVLFTICCWTPFYNMQSLAGTFYLQSTIFGLTPLLTKWDLWLDSSNYWTIYNLLLDSFYNMRSMAGLLYLQYAIHLYMAGLLYLQYTYNLWFYICNLWLFLLQFAIWLDSFTFTYNIDVEILVHFDLLPF